MVAQRVRQCWLLLALLLPGALLAAAGTTARRVVGTGGSVIISEVAWGGTRASSSDEWIELHNPTDAAIDLGGWRLAADDGSPTIALTGTLPAGGFWLLERGDDAVSDIAADRLFSGALLNDGETLRLYDAAGAVIDTANQDGGGWPAGSGSPNYRSMERVRPDSADDAAGWVANDGSTRNGADADGNPLDGTPRQPNSAWSGGGDQADLTIAKFAPPAAQAGVPFSYTLRVVNQGALAAGAVVVTDTLPPGVTRLADNAPVAAMQPVAGTLVWALGTLPPSAALSWHLTVTTAADAGGALVNRATVSTPDAETTTANNAADATTVLATRALLLNELLADPPGDANGDGVTTTFGDEFVELVNNSGTDLLLAGWRLYDAAGSAPRHIFAPTSFLPDGCALVVFGAQPHGAFGGALVEAASSGQLSLNNAGDTLTLTDADGVPVLTYSYGSEGDANQALTRSPDVIGPEPLVRHTTVAAAAGRPFSPGTRVDLTPFRTDCQRPDVAVTLAGPAAVSTGAPVSYRVGVRNVGGSSAPGVTLSATLAAGLSYSADSSGLPTTHPAPDRVVWSVGTLAADSGLTFTLQTATAAGLHGAFTSVISATVAGGEFVTGNNHAAHTTLVGDSVLINALLFDPYVDASEALQLINVGTSAVDLAGWQIGSATRRVTLPATSLPAGGTLWLAKEHAAFRRYFGFSAAFDGSALGGWPGYANSGGAALLYHRDGSVIDALVYEDGPTDTPGWQGAAVRAYGGGGLAKKGQILYRQRDQHSGRPLADSHSAADWIQTPDDHTAGRRVRYPGWDEGAFFHTQRVTQTATLTIAIAPDNAFATVGATIAAAQRSIRISALTFSNWALAQRLADAAGRGVAVDLLLEGAPPGGLIDQTRAVCQLLEAAGGRCWFMINEAQPAAIFDRYDYLHAKYILIDDRLALIGSDNFSAGSMPYDDFGDGTAGRRGALLITDAPGVVARLDALWQADHAPDQHADILRWTADHPLYANRYGAPPVGFIPDQASGGISYTVRYPQPTTLHGTFGFELISAPENNLRTVDSLLGLIGRAGMGDTLYVQQLDEPPFWGGRDGSVSASPNPRLAAYIDAARRGADVWLMLDRFFGETYFTADDPQSNAQTCLYLSDLARRDGLRLRCQLGNPTGLGIHNKMVLAQIDGRGYVHIGSLNGTEQSNKANREVALQVQSDQAYALLAAMFTADWTHRAYLPLAAHSAPGRADHLVISEIFYNPPGTDDLAEFIEIANPTGAAVNIGGYSVADAVNWDDFEDTRRFPPGSVIASGGVVVVAYDAQAFFALFNRWPDFEIADSTAHVPQMLDHPLIGNPEAQLRLANEGDEVLLRDAADRPIDVVTYGTGVYPGVVAALPVSSSGRSLARTPYTRDTNNGLTDFREGVPTPGIVGIP